MKRMLLAVDVRMDDYPPFLRPFFWRHQCRALAVRRPSLPADFPAGRRFSALGFFPAGAFSAAGSSSVGFFAAGFFSALGAIDAAA